MRVSIIAAMGRNRVIGKDGRIPWHLPADLKLFKARTMYSFLLVGRKTWESIGRPLPGREMVVISRKGDLVLPAGVHRAASLEQALAMARGDEVFVAGGGEIYRLALPLTDRIYLTVVDAEPEGDVTFPELEDGDWRQIGRECHVADERNELDFEVLTYDRLARSGASDRTTSGEKTSDSTATT